MSKLLALDQASRITGYAVFDGDKLIDYGKITANDEDVGQRLVFIRNEINKLIDCHNIDEIVLEDIQLQNNVVNNVQTFKTLAEVFGVLYELATERKIKNSAVLASSWKSTLGIKGRDRAAQKRAAQEWVIKTYNVKPTQDECDAICIGTHTLTNKDLSFNWD